MPKSSNLFTNSIFNLAGQIVPLLVGLITIPLLIRNLGLESFGLLSLLWVFLGYLAFLDLGMSRAIIKQVAEDLSKNLRWNIPSLMSSAITVISIVSVISSLILILSANYLAVHLFKIPTHLEEEARNSIFVVAASIPLITITALYRGVLEAEQRFLSANVLQASVGTLTYVVPLLGSVVSKSLFHIMILLFITRLFSLVVHIWFAQKILPEVLVWKRPDHIALKRVLYFGSWLTISSLISPLMVYFDRFVLGTFVDVASLAFYTTPYEIITRALIIPNAVARVMFPSFIAAFAEDKDNSWEIYLRTIKIMTFVMFPICAAVIVFSHLGLQLWLGENFAERSSLILSVLAIGVFVNSLANIPYTFVQSANRPDLTAKIHLLELPIYIVMIYFLTSHYGLMGAALSWTSRLVLDTVLLFIFASRVAGKKFEFSWTLISVSLVLVALVAIHDMPHFTAWGVSLVILSIVWLWGWLLSTEDRLLIRQFGNLKLPEVKELPTLKNSCAIVVTYNPNEDFLSNVHQALRQFDRVIIVDNHSSEDALKLIETFKDSPQVNLIFNSKNLGIAKALNQGFEKAIFLGYKWIATFDQDSYVSDGFLNEFIETSRKHPEAHRIGIYAPIIQEKAIDAKLNGIHHIDYYQVPSVITSGSLVYVETFQKVGGFREEFFVDYVDHEFALKVRQQGFLVIINSKAKLLHELGRSRWHKLGPWEFHCTHHSPARRYFITRNRLLVYRSFILIEPAWIFRDIYLLFKEILKIAIAEEEKAKKTKAFFKGLIHALRGRFDNEIRL